MASLSAQGSSPKHTSLKIKRLAAAAHNIPQNACDNTAYRFVLPDQKSVQVITKQWTDEHRGVTGYFGRKQHVSLLMVMALIGRDPTVTRFAAGLLHFFCFTSEKTDLI